jgi:hypothetical protein
MLTGGGISLRAAAWLLLVRYVVDLLDGWRLSFLLRRIILQVCTNPCWWLHNYVLVVVVLKHLG